jgi:hypothetical protein
MPATRFNSTRKIKNWVGMIFEGQRKLCPFSFAQVKFLGTRVRVRIGKVRDCETGQCYDQILNATLRSALSS